MEGYDRNPCCGTHYPTLGSLRLLHILPGTSKVRGTNVRLYFAVGQRAINELVSAFNTATDLTRSLECARSEAVGRLDQLVQREKAVRKRESRLKEEVGFRVSTKLVSRLVEQIPSELLLQDRKGNDDRLPSKSITSEGPTTYDVCPGYLCVAAEIYRPDADSEMVSWILKGMESEFAREPRAHTLLLAIRTGPSGREDPVPGATAGLTVKAFVTTSRSDRPNPQPQMAPPEKLLTKFSDRLRSSSVFTGRLKGGGKGQWQGKLIARESEPFARWTSEEANEVHALIQNASQEW